MKFNKKILIMLVVPLCLVLSSCGWLNSFLDENYDDTKEFQKEMVEKILTSFEKNNSDGFKDLFSDKVISMNNLDGSVDEIFTFFKGTVQNIEYYGPALTEVIENGNTYKFEECVAYIETDKKTYTLDFLIWKNKEHFGIVSFVISTIDRRETEEFREYIINVFNEAKCFDERYLGAFVY